MVCWLLAGYKVIEMFIDGIERRPYILITSQEGVLRWRQKQNGR